MSELGKLPLAAVDLQKVMESKEMAAKQERVFVHNAEMQRVGLANQFLSLPEGSRNAESTQAANDAVKRFMEKEITLGPSEVESFVKTS